MGDNMEMRGIREMADALTAVLDQGKGAPSPIPTKEFGSYWDQWLARRTAQSKDPQDLLTKYLMGQGDRPDIGAGIQYMGYMGNFNDAAEASSSAGSSGGALTISNLGNINPERQKIRRL